VKEVTNTQFVTFVLNEKSRPSVRLGACGRVDVYSIVRLWPELLAFFKQKSRMFIMRETIWGYRDHIIIARLASGSATRFLMKLPFSEGGLNYGIF